MPESEDPPERKAEEHDTPDHKSEVSLDDYHHHADQFLDKLMATLELKSEEDHSLDVEYSVRTGSHSSAARSAVLCHHTYCTTSRRLPPKILI
jgi:hypothetical protein